MKTHRKRMALGPGRGLAALALWFAAANPDSNAGVFVYENEHEFTASADFDGDGRTDVVIANKATGAYRVLYQASADTFAAAGPNASGMEDLTGFALGQFFIAGRAAFAFTCPAANRVNVFDGSSAAASSAPASIYLQMPGTGAALHPAQFPGAPAHLVSPFRDRRLGHLAPTQADLAFPRYGARVL